MGQIEFVSERLYHARLWEEDAETTLHALTHLPVDEQCHLGCEW